MKPARGQAGYTIVETMIFLMISSVLLVATVGMFTKRIQHTQFTQSVQAVATRLKTTANEVSTGTYAANSFNCTNSAGVPVVSPGGAKQGARSGCIFVGKVVNFAVAGGGCADDIIDHKCEDIATYTVVGRREVDTSTHRVVTSVMGIDGSKPRVVTNPNISQTYNIGYGTRVTAIYLKDSPTSLIPISAVGLFQNFGGSYSNGELGSGSQNVTYWTISTQTTPLYPQTINGIANAVAAESMDGPNPDGEILICFKSGAEDQTASITLVNENGTLEAVVKVDDTLCPA